MPKKPTNATITPPIPDINKNGILDGQDLLRQMKAEEVNGGERAASERAHGVLEALGTRFFTNEVNDIAARGLTLRPDAFHIIAAKMNQNIEQQVAATRDKMSKDPKYAQKAEEDIRKLSQELHLSPTNTEMNVADERNFNDFVRTFATTFPNGVKIEAKDVPEILSHFGGLAVHVPSTPAPARKEKGLITI